MSVINNFESYQCVGWQNGNAGGTPLGATRQNIMDSGIKKNNEYIQELDHGKVDIVDNPITSLNFDVTTGIITVTCLDGSTEQMDLSALYQNATTSQAGLMSAADKAKLNGIAAGANKTSITNNLLATKAGTVLDAVQGRILAERINAKSASKHIGSAVGTTGRQSYCLGDIRGGWKAYLNVFEPNSLYEYGDWQPLYCSVNVNGASKRVPMIGIPLTLYADDNIGDNYDGFGTMFCENPLYADAVSNLVSIGASTIGSDVYCYMTPKSTAYYYELYLGCQICSQVN